MVRYKLYCRIGCIPVCTLLILVCFKPSTSRYIAKYVSNPAGRLGRYYSRGKSLSDIVPTSATEAFETFTGVSDVKKEARMSRLMRKSDLQEALRAMEEEDFEIVFESGSETAATIVAEGMYTSASEFLRAGSSGDVKKTL